MEMSQIHGLRVLLVEDESLIAMLIEDALIDMNCTVAAVATTCVEALEKASLTDFDIAILDVNLNGSPVYPVAELLVKKRIPFIFSTGYGAAAISEKFQSIPVLAKPFDPGDLERMIGAILTSSE